MSAPLVVVDADVLGRSRTGDESYVRELLTALPPLVPDMRLAAVTRRPDLVPAGVEPIELPAASQVARMSWSLPRLLDRLRPALAHFQYAIPLGFSGRSLVTVHDVSFLGTGALMPLADRLRFRAAVGRSIPRAARVVTGSEFSRTQIVARYRCPPGKVQVTPYGVGAGFAPDGPRARRPPYALFVGTLHPRKHPLLAVEALALTDTSLTLVLAGPDRGLAGAIRARARSLGIGERVELLGHVEEHELAALYRGAACLVFPSRYEGFGLPVLEAMACGTPVVATRTSSIPEIAGGAAILTAPDDPVELAGGIERALADRERLVAAGLERARRYDWRDTARLTADAYRSLLP